MIVCTVLVKKRSPREGIQGAKGHLHVIRAEDPVYLKIKVRTDFAQYGLSYLYAPPAKALRHVMPALPGRQTGG